MAFIDLGDAALSPAGWHRDSKGRDSTGATRPAPIRKASLRSTIPILSPRPLLLDDRVLVALLVGERLPFARRAKYFTTTYFYYRACRAVVAGVGGRLSGPFERVDPDRRAAGPRADACPSRRRRHSRLEICRPSDGRCTSSASEPQRLEHRSRRCCHLVRGEDGAEHSYRRRTARSGATCRAHHIPDNRSSISRPTSTTTGRPSARTAEDDGLKPGICTTTVSPLTCPAWDSYR